VYRDELIVGGAFAQAGGVGGTSRVARWDGNAGEWRAMGTGVSGAVNSLAVHDDQVFVVGSFLLADGRPATRWARWQGFGVPTITDHPDDVTGCPGGQVQFAVGAVGNGQVSYEWFKGNVPLVNGGRVSGADTEMLVITGVEAGDAGSYSCFVSSACGATSSEAAVLSFCLANCDCSTVAPTLNVNDFICFQGKFAAGDPAANCDGSTTAPVLNVNDFICFQQRYAAGCP